MTPARPRGSLAGVDLSSRKLSVAILSRDPLRPEVLQEFEAPGDLAAARFVPLVQWFRGMLNQHGPRLEVVYVEGLPFVKNRDSFISLACVLGAVRAVCALKGVRCVVVDGRDWKKALGSGSTKAHIAAWAAGRGRTFETQDLCDAWAIAQYGTVSEAW